MRLGRRASAARDRGNAQIRIKIEIKNQDQESLIMAITSLIIVNDSLDKTLYGPLHNPAHPPIIRGFEGARPHEICVVSTTMRRAA
jgi:hypothetical protein